MEFLFVDWLGKPVWMWLGFHALVGVLLAFDLGVLQKLMVKNDAGCMSVRESLLLSLFYVSLGLAFGVWVWWAVSPESGLEYLTGFVIEKSLSMDNVFVIAMIFGYFAIPLKSQYRVLFWGILAVILLRGLMIGVGAALVESYGWVLYIFAAFLVFTGVKMLFVSDEQYDVENNPVYRLLRKRFRMTKDLHGESFFVRQADPATGKLVTFMTPLFVVLVMVNVADIIFAVDSVPAIFAITTDTFIVYTSNIFAILGLRALYFALAAMVERFKYLKFALALVLVFIGGKIFVADMLDLAKIPPTISLGVTFAILGAGVVWSLWKTAPSRAT
jgi:tellurite resistance protein TerC